MECQEEMEPDRRVKARARAEVWVQPEEVVEDEAGVAGSPWARVVIVSAPVVGQLSRTR